MNLGKTASFLKYDIKRATIEKPDESHVIPFGVYTIFVTVDGDFPQSFSVIFLVGSLEERK